MTPTASQLARYAANPMEFFADLTVPRVGQPFRECWATFQQDWFAAVSPTLLALARGQKAAVRRYLLERVKGASKTPDVAACIIWLLAFAGHRLLIQVAADDFDQANEVWKAVRDWTDANKWLQPVITLHRGKAISERNGAELNILTRDDFGGHGGRPDLLVVDELSHLTSDGPAQTCFDNLSKNPRGVAVLATNAGFLNTMAHQWRQRALASSGWHTQIIKRTPPWQDERDIQEAKDRNPESRYNRLYRGIWASPGGDSFGEETIEAAMVHDGPMTRRPGDYGGGMIGIDLGITTHHAALSVVLCQYDRRIARLAVVKDYAPPVDIEEVYRDVIRFVRRFGLGLVAADPWQAESMLQRLEAKGIHCERVHATSENLSQQAIALWDLLKNRRLELYPDALLTADLHGTQLLEQARGHRLVFPEDKNGHGDRLASLSLTLPVIKGAMDNYAPPPHHGGVVGSLFPPGYIE